MEHRLLKQSINGHGSWMQCEKCGCTNHSGLWFFAGYQSKEPPPCPDDIYKDGVYKEWAESASKLKV